MKPRLVNWTGLSALEKADCLRRPAAAQEDQMAAAVKALIDEVRARGDAAVRELTRRFDGADLASSAVTDTEFDRAFEAVPMDVQNALREAHARLVAWHQAGAPREFEIETAPGVSCGRVLRGITRVGLYVPAGSAPLPSTALMLGVPARLAGCEEVLLCTPPRRDGEADPTVLVAAKISGISRVFKIGGVQAIAAMAFGTETVPSCDKLFGPGNAYVTLAKQQVSARADGPSIDIPAGPSEVLVVADEGARPAFVAADLLAQAEHGPDSQVILVTTSAALANEVSVELERQTADLPRADIARLSLAHARLIIVRDVAEAMEVSNAYAPEHLILAVRDPRAALSRVRAAGSVFLGDHTPESLGDYCSGTNHVLPTNGAARAWSGVSVASFETSISIQSATPAGLAAIGPCAATLARAEGLEGHARAVTLRLEARS